MTYQSGPDYGMTPEMAQRLQKSLDILESHIANKAIPLFKAIGEAMVSLGPLMEQMEEIYKKTGAPYGNSKEGFSRWLADWAKIAEYQYAIKCIHAKHSQLSFLRKNLDKS